MIKDAIRRMFGQVSQRELMQRELDSAGRALLEALSAAEYAEAMCVYHRARIERLTATLKEQT